MKDLQINTDFNKQQPTRGSIDEDNTTTCSITLSPTVQKQVQRQNISEQLSDIFYLGKSDEICDIQQKNIGLSKNCQSQNSLSSNSSSGRRFLDTTKYQQYKINQVVKICQENEQKKRESFKIEALKIDDDINSENKDSKYKNYHIDSNLKSLSNKVAYYNKNKLINDTRVCKIMGLETDNNNYNNDLKKKQEKHRKTTLLSDCSFNLCQEQQQVQIENKKQSQQQIQSLKVNKKKKKGGIKFDEEVKVFTVENWKKHNYSEYNFTRAEFKQRQKLESGKKGCIIF